MNHIRTGTSPDPALPETASHDRADPQDRTERQLRTLEELSNRAINVVRTLHRRLQRPADAPEPTPAEARELRETAALFLRAVRETRQIVESEARIVANAEALLLRREKLTQTAKSRRAVDQLRAARNRRVIKDNVHTAILVECPAEEIHAMEAKLGHLMSELTIEDLVNRSVDDNVARLRRVLNIVDRSYKSDLGRWPPPGDEGRPP